MSAPIYVEGNAADGLAGPALPVTTTRGRFLVVDGAGNRTRRSFYFNIGPRVAPGDFREETIYFLITTHFSAETASASTTRPAKRKTPTGEVTSAA